MTGEQISQNKTKNVSTKVPIWFADWLNIICAARGTDIYGLMKLVLEFIAETAKVNGPVPPQMQSLLGMLKMDADWNKAFAFSDPSAQMDVAQVILILQQKGKHGFGAVMIDKPWMGMKPKMVDDLDPMRGDPQMTENVDDILERVTEVCMHGIYRRLRLMGARMDCKNLSDVLLTLVDAQTVLEMDEESKAEMKGEAMYDVRGRRIEYGKKTKGFKHRTPDSLDPNRNRLLFQDIDHETGEDSV